MNHQHHQSVVEYELRRHGASSARALAGATRLSQPTISRLLADMRDRIVRIGQGRNSRYALRRPIREFGSSWPIYDIDQAGSPRRIGTLSALENRQWHFQQDTPWKTLRGRDFRDGLYPDLPWFLEDARPQGFLGKIFAKSHGAALGISNDSRLWSIDDVWVALLRFGSDVPGSFVVGEAMLAAAQNSSNRILSPNPETYSALAEATLAGEWPGSSAAGEQPKFTAQISESKHVIVKFSPPFARPEGRRWADLLVCESLAATVMREHGILACDVRILASESRYFLESSRFDRVGKFGRRGVVSLASLDAAYIGGLNSPWRICARQLQEQGWIGAETATRLTTAWWFGSMIANSDMHYGNASFFLTPQPPLELAPIYDMTPMVYRPDAEGGLPERSFEPPPPLPEELAEWRVAASMAEIFWSRVARSKLVSATFQTLADRNRDLILQSQLRFIKA